MVQGSCVNLIKDQIMEKFPLYIIEYGRENMIIVGSFEGF